MTAPTAGENVSGLSQLEAWHRRVLPSVEQLAGDLWSIPVPIPDSPLRYVSAYVFLAGDGGLVLLDPGWDSEESWQALCSGLRELNAAPADVRGILISHMHLDHSGLASRLREASGAWIAMHPADHAMIARPDFRDPAVAVSQTVAFLRSLGASAHEAAEAVGSVERFTPFTTIALPDRELSDGDLADVPGWQLRAAHTPGHSPGHLCFIDESSRRLFTGDHVLPRITPNISVGRAENYGVLHDYLDSLAKVRALEVEEILPGHEWRFRDLAERVDVLVGHHERRLAELCSALARQPDSTPWELSSQLTWSRPWDQYSGRVLLAAVTETAAHVHELVRRGLVTSHGERVPKYRVSNRSFH